MPVSTPDDQASLDATFKSPSDTHNFQYTLSSPSKKDSQQPDPKAKAEYLHQLRASSKKLQDDINDFLTRKMEEDKQAGLDTNKSKIKEELEEENYGEEDANNDEG